MKSLYLNFIKYSCKRGISDFNAILWEKRENEKSKSKGNKHPPI